MFFVALVLYLNSDLVKNAKNNTAPIPSPIVQKQQTASPTPAETANWETYQDQYLVFKHPPTWRPKPAALYGGATLETISMGIPGITSDQTLGFGAVLFSEIKPDDAIRQNTISIGGKLGAKWIRKGENYISYDYYTTGYQNQGHFGVHVTIVSEDKNLESQLDEVVQSIQFR